MCLSRRRETEGPATAGRTGAPPPRVRRARPLPAFVVRCPVQGRTARLRGGRPGRVAGRRRGGARGGGGRGRSAPWRPARSSSRPPRHPDRPVGRGHAPAPLFALPPGSPVGAYGTPCVCRTQERRLSARPRGVLRESV